ncbi:MAG: hypothetical protein Q4G42_03085 [Neisseria sp.]|nr:hypothetical protein [Neisseria sp.]
MAWLDGSDAIREPYHTEPPPQEIPYTIQDGTAVIDYSPHEGQLWQAAPEQELLPINTAPQPLQPTNSINSLF